MWYCPNPGDHPSRVGCVEAIIAEHGEPDPGAIEESAAAEERGSREQSSGSADAAPSLASCSDLVVGQTSPAIQITAVATIPSATGGVIADGTYVLTRRESVADEAHHTYRAVLRIRSDSTRFELASAIEDDSELGVSGTSSFDRDGRLRMSATCPVPTALPYDRFVSSDDSNRVVLVSTTLRQASTFVRWSPDRPTATTSPGAATTPAAIPPAPAAAPETPDNDHPRTRRRRHHS